MKWFKHMAGASRDPKIIALRQCFGLEGVARYWMILEMIAEEMNESDRCEITLPEMCWKDRLHFYHLKQALIYLEYLSNVGLISIQCSSDVPLMVNQSITILCPNLLKIRDHRIKNRVHKSAPEVEEDSRSRRRTPIVPKGDDTKFEIFWNAYPKKVGKKAALREWQKIKPDEELANQIVAGVLKHKTSKKWQEGFILDPERFLKHARWTDEVQTTHLNGSGTKIDDGEDEWVKMMEHIRRFGSSQRCEGISEKARIAINKIGGMPMLGRALTKDIPFIKKDFKNKYMEVKNESN